LPKLFGIVGVLVICAGLDLLWQCRSEIRFWIAAYVKVLRAVLQNRESPQRLFPGEEASGYRRGAFRFLLGMALVFLFGPALIVIGVTLFFNLHL
jgi:hypothetical protein